MRKLIWFPNGESDGGHVPGELLLPAQKSAGDAVPAAFHFDLPKLVVGVESPVVDIGFVGPLPIAITTPLALVSGPIAPVASPIHSPGLQPKEAPMVLAAQQAATITQQQVTAFIQGFEQQLTKVEENLLEQVFGDALPLLGDNLLDAAAQGVQALHYVTGLKAAINSGLGTLTGAATYTQTQVQQAITNALNSANIQIFNINLNATNPADIRLSLNTSKAFTAFSVPLDGGFGMPGIGLKAGGNANATISYAFNLGVGLDGDGFYINTANNASSLSTTFAMGIPGLDIEANLGRLHFSVKDEALNDGDFVSPTSFNGTFAIALKDQGADQKIRLNELNNDLLDATLSGTAAINLNLESKLEGPPQNPPPEAPMFPAISADLNFAWQFSSAAVESGDLNPNFGGLPSLAFKNVKIDLGTFFTNFARPILEKVKILTDRTKPIIDGLKMQVPILQKIEEVSGQDIPTSLLEYMEFRGTISPESAARIELLDKLTTLVDSVPPDGGSAKIDLGDFAIVGDPRNQSFLLSQAGQTILRTAQQAIQQSQILNQFMDKVDALPNKGMEFPIVENPSSAFGLLLGKDVEFFTYDAPDFRLDPPPEIDEFIKIVGPIGVRLKGKIEAKAILDFGYDSRGLIDWATDPAGAFSHPEKIFNGFYVVNVPGPEASADARATASLALNLAVVEAGVGGGIEGHAEIGLHDPTPGDGKVRGIEILEGIDEGGCLFDVAGSLDSLLSAYVTIGFDDPFDLGWFEHTFTFDGPRLELINLNGLRCDANVGELPAVLAHTQLGVPGGGGGPQLAEAPQAAQAGDIILHVGSDAYLRVGGVTMDIAESIHVSHVSGGIGSETVSITGFGVDPLIVMTGSGRLTGDAGLFNDALQLDANVVTAAEFRGGPGNDALSGGALGDLLYGNSGSDVLVGNGGNDLLDGAGDFDVLDGGDGNDTLLAADGPDLLIGGAGADELNGGPGDDTASYRTAAAGVVIDFSNLTPSAGDAVGDTFISIERIFGSNFADSFFGSSTNDYLDGGPGNDILSGRGGNDVLVGGLGADAFDGGFGVDFASYLDALEGVALSLLTGGTGGEAAGDTFTDVENVEGTDFNDTLEGDNFANFLRGLNGNNTLRGLGGNDTVDGAKGDDLLDGGDGNDLLRADYDGQATVVTSDGVTPGTGLPEGGKDTMFGGAGNDTLDAGAGDDVLNGGADDDLLFGGKGNDQLNGDDGNDLLDGGDGTDALAGGAGNDQIDGGLHNDTANGGAGNDTVLGNEGDDMLHGAFGFDRLEGGNGNDLLEVGDLRGAVQDLERVDHLFGGAGFDTISADFSTQTVSIAIIAGQTHNLVFADGTEAHDFENVHDLATGSADDLLRLNTASDDGFGNYLLTGAGNDVVYSGLGVDYVDLGPGDDFVNGGAGRATDAPPSPIVVPFPRWDYVGGQLRVVGYTGNTLIGGPGVDTVEFDPLFINTQPPFQGQVFGYIVGAVVNLETGLTDNAAAGTSLSGFENVTGTDYQDSLTGDAGPNVLRPMRGGGYGSAGGSGPDGVDGRGGEDTVIIDYSREDLPTSTGINLNTNLGGPTLGYSRLTPDSPSWYYDTVQVSNIEHCIVTGASKDDRLGPANSYNFSDVFIGLGGNDIIWGLNGSDTMLGGEGNDSLYGLSTILTVNIASPDVDGTDFFDGGNGDDDIVDFQAGSINVEPGVKPDAILQLDGGPGFDTLSPDFGNQTAPIVWTDLAPTNLEFANGAYARNFERTRYFGSGSGDDSITQSGRVDNWIYTRAGNDVIYPGLGNDDVNGGAGNDLVVLDYSILDLPEYTGLVQGGGGTTISTRRDHPGAPVLVVDSILGMNIERMHLTATSKDDRINDLVGDDVILCGAGNDTVFCSSGGNNYVDLGDGNDTITGASAFTVGLTANDTILGGPGNDTIDAGNDSDVVSGGPGNDTIRGDVQSTRFGGLDTFDGGDGDDVIDEWVGQVSDSTYTVAGTRLQLDGGPGFDTLFADYGYATQAIVLDMQNPQPVEHADGSYIRNFELLRDFVSGAGNDVLVQLGRVNNDWATRSGDDIVNPGLGIDRAVGGPGDDLLIIDYSVGDDPQLGGVTFSANFQADRRNTTTNAFVDYIAMASFERHWITGGTKADSITTTTGPDILRGGAGNDTLNSSGGDDLLDGGPGNDAMNGGTGNDTYVVDAIADVIAGESAGADIDTVRAVIDYVLGANLENLILEGRALSGTGNTLANSITGNARNNDLHGGAGNDVLTGGLGLGLAGSHEVDLLEGGAGADTFVLGDADFRYYDDRSSLSPGVDGYARLVDFAPSAGDKLKLKGTAAEYFLGASPVAGLTGKALFHDSNFNALFDPGFDELLAILDSPEALTAANTIHAAIFI